MSPSCASSQAGKSVNVTNHQLAKCKSPKMQITLWERFQKSLIDHPHHPPPHPPHHEQGLSVVALQLCKVLIQLKRSPGNRCLHKFSLIALHSEYLANPMQSKFSNILLSSLSMKLSSMCFFRGRWVGVTFRFSKKQSQRPLRH